MESNKVLRFVFYTCLLILISSPAFSLTKALSLTTNYIPNEKISLLIICLASFNSVEKIIKFFHQYKKIIFISLILALYVLAKDFAIFHRLEIKNINFVITTFSIIIYFNFFKKLEPSEYSQMFLITSWLHISVALSQLWFHWSGQKEIVMLLHNHPYQENYYMGDRPSGLLMESSQFTSFLALVIILLSYQFQKITSTILKMSTILPLLLQGRSTTAFGLLFAHTLSRGKRGFVLVVLFFVLIGFDFLTLKIGKNIYLFVFDKISRSLSFTAENAEYDRFSSALKELGDLSNSVETLFMGSTKAVSEVPSFWLSYYWHYIGFIGIVLFLIYLFLILKKSKLEMIAAYATLCITNAQITSPINMLFLVSAMYVGSQFHGIKHTGDHDHS